MPKIKWDASADRIVATSRIREACDALGVTPKTVVRRRKMLRDRGRKLADHRRENVGRKPPATDWTGVNWELPNEDIAVAVGVATSTVGLRRRQIVGRTHPIDWSAVDWTRSTTDIARSLGVVYEAARRQRKRYQSMPLDTAKIKVRREALGLSQSEAAERFLRAD